VRVKEFKGSDGTPHHVRIDMSLIKGDRSRMFGRNGDSEDVPLVIAYNMGIDFELRTQKEKQERVMSMLKMLRVGVNQVMEDIGKLTGTGGS